MRQESDEKKGATRSDSRSARRFYIRRRSAVRLQIVVSALGQLIELAGLIGIVIVVIWVAILEAQDVELATYKQTPALTLLAVLSIAAHIFFERIVVIPERKRENSRLRRQLGAIRRHMDDMATDNEGLQKHIRAAGHYIQLQDLKSRIQPYNSEFSVVAEESLREPFLLLERLARGRLDVPELEISSVMALLSRSYSQRIDAVSNEDLDFWLGREPVASEYLRQNKSAIRAGTVITRIFIISVKDLDSNMETLKRVLCDQYELGVRWGLCISDEFDSDLRHVYNVRFDFALFDKGKAITYFRKTTTRRFEAVFSTGLTHHENDREILRQMELYSKLIGECWMVTGGFQETFAGAFANSKYPVEGAVESIQRRGQAHNELLRAAMGDQVTVEGDPFVFVIRSMDEIHAKLNKLADTVRKYRE